MWCIISDLDGTLLDSSQRIPAEVIARIQRFENAGGRFTFATGRSLDSVMPYLGQAGITTPVILYNGAIVYHPVTGEFIYERFLETRKTEDIVSAFQDIQTEYEISLLAFDREGAYYLEETEFIKKQLRKDGIRAQRTSAGELLTKQLIKIMLIGGHEHIHELKNLFSAFQPINSEPELLEFIATGVNKGAAVKFLMDYLDIPSQQLAAVGDNENDLEMLQTAGLGISVRNAVPSIKAVSDYVTRKTNTEHALIEVIEKLEETNYMTVMEHGGLRR
ncbi:Cof-type HAD-IIB family hydrolase [Bacillus sp. T33-2]|uniref:Cof-type HAD-IIB family hydrolase n=1 Tax=Bacillus sp. T33-2 TaxID=2054168 RepID=UPI000C78F580|nr:Cof-type HAD-IIB family hydrolase [Bacillus sp. T33-2]PLR95786.1 hypothetical protein CVD19_13725 [Bacillus sp. T33-2]